MKYLRPKQELGVSLTAVVVSIGVIAIIAVLLREQIAAAFLPAPRRLQIETTIGHESHWFQPDKYFLVVGICHRADTSLTGGLVFQIKGPGKIHPFDARNQPEATIVDDHTARMMVKNWEAGPDNMKSVVFDLNSSKLNENGLTEAQVKARILLKVDVMFAKPGDDIDHATNWSQEIGQGSPD